MPSTLQVSMRPLSPPDWQWRPSLLTSFPGSHLLPLLAPLRTRSARPPPHTHSNFKKPVDAIAFSPDDQFVAVSHGNHTKVWRAPALRREFSPFSLHRTYTGHHADVICLSWSPDSQFLLTGSKDNSARLYTLHPQAGFIPNTFGGHRDHIIGAFFAPNVSGGDDFTIVYTVTKDGAVLEWQWVPDEAVKAIADVEKAEEEEEEEEEVDGFGGDDFGGLGGGGLDESFGLDGFDTDPAW